MVPDLTDTIVAIGTAPGGSARGVVRLTGPGTHRCVASCFQPDSYDVRIEDISFAQVVEGTLVVESGLTLPCDLFLWPNEQSYTRQPTAELHTIGSPPLLEQVVAELCRQGARMAEPGEFTLRAFLAGRIDLTQAEAVLGVIDAADGESLHMALGQLAGGLSRPLSLLREQLLQLLAHLEAGLDFVEEDISFISAAEIEEQLNVAMGLVATTLEQLADRATPTDLPKVVLIGRPNAGKSTLFNVLVERYGAGKGSERALVSHHAGTTRDYLSATVCFEGILLELVDTAGEDPFFQETTIAGMAQGMTVSQRRQADLVILCVDARETNSTELEDDDERTLTVLTKVDLLRGELVRTGGSRMIWCSALTGVGLDRLTGVVHELLENQLVGAGVVASTAARCSESLRLGLESLKSALELVTSGGGEELIAVEVRRVLNELGQVVGAVYTDDVLDRIFSQFCIGK